MNRGGMRTMGLFEAKQKLSELVQRASEGESIGITRRGKLAAVISSPRSRSDLREVFDRIEQIRTRVRRPKRFRIKERSEEHTSELQSRGHLVCRLLLEKKNEDIKRKKRN